MRGAVRPGLRRHCSALLRTAKPVESHTGDCDFCTRIFRFISMTSSSASAAIASSFFVASAAYIYAAGSLRPVPMSVLHKMLTTNRVRGHCLHSRTRRKRIASSPGRSQLTAHLCTSRRLKQDSVGNDDSGWRTSRDRTTRRLSRVLQDSPAMEIGGIITGNSRVQLNDSDWLPRSPDCRCGSCARSGRRIPGHPDQIPYRCPFHRPCHRLQGLHVTINGTRFRSRPLAPRPLPPRS